MEHDCGLGKTVTAIEVAKQLRDKPGFIRTQLNLVVCKKGNRQQWVETLAEQDPEAAVEVWEGPDDLWRPPYDKPRWIVTHYEAVNKIAPFLARFLWSVYVTDEAHRIKNRKAKRSTNVAKVEAIRKVALTATPFDKNPADYWNILHWLEPHFFTSYWAFRRKFVDEVQFGEYSKIVGVKNKEQLLKLLAPYVDKATKETVAPELPERIEQDIYVEMTPRQRKVYERIRGCKDIECDLSEFGGPAEPLLLTSQAVRLMYLEQAASCPGMLEVPEPGAKIPWLLEYIEDAPAERFIVFTRFRHTAIRLARLTEGHSSLVIGGQKDPDAEVRLFRKGVHRIMIGTIAALCEGYDFPDVGTAVFVEADPSSIKMKQALDRIHRLGIKDAKNVIYLMSKGTVDTKRIKAVRNKWTEQQLLEELQRTGEL